MLRDSWRSFVLILPSRILTALASPRTLLSSLDGSAIRRGGYYNISTMIDYAHCVCDPH